MTISPVIAHLGAEGVRAFERRVIRGEGCWYMRGRNGAPITYGRPEFCWRKKRVLAARIACALANPDMQMSDFACHHCDNKLCVRGGHLFPGTATDNMQDMLKKHVHPKRRNMATRCSRGHALTPENTVVWSSGRRDCLTCHRRRCREGKSREAERRNADPAKRAAHLARRRERKKLAKERLARGEIVRTGKRRSAKRDEAHSNLSAVYVGRWWSEEPK